MRAARFAFVIDGADEVGTSGDLAWCLWKYEVADQSGTAVDTGRYLVVSRNVGGKRHIIRDAWNSDAPLLHPRPRQHPRRSNRGRVAGSTSQGPLPRPFAPTARANRYFAAGLAFGSG
jgi:hypothetical protein